MRLYRPLFMILSGAFFLWGGAAAGPAGRPLDIDDVMRIEGVGNALIHPEGRWVHFEKVRPYKENTDFSFRTYAYQKSGHQIWRYDRRGTLPPDRLPGLEGGTHTYLLSYSPSGRYLAFMQYSFGALKLGAYDLTEDRAVLFGRTPAFSRTGEHNPVWLPGDDLVFAALPQGELPMATSVRAFTGQTLSRAWQDAWEGRVSTANEVRTRMPDRSGQSAEGSLVRANPSTGESVVLAEGLYADIKVSPDGQRLASLSVSKPRGFDPDRPAIYDTRRYTLSVIDLDTGGQVRPVGALEFFPYTLEWSPDSRRIAGFGWRGSETSTEGRFTIVDLEKQTFKRFDHTGLDLVSERERGWLQRPERVLFFGDRLAVFARPIPAGEDPAPRFSPANVRPTGLPEPAWFAVSEDGRSVRLETGLEQLSGIPVDAGEGQITLWGRDGISRIYVSGERQLVRAEAGSQFNLIQAGTFATRESVIRPDWSDEAIFAISGKPGTGALQLDLGKERLRVVARLGERAGNAFPLASSAPTGAAIFQSRERSVSTVELVDTSKAGQAVELARLNTHLSEIDFGRWELLTYEVPAPSETSAPLTVSSCVLLPPGYDPESPPPLIVDVYPDASPRCADGDMALSYPDPDSPYIWAGKGYAYARLTAPRSLIRTPEGPIGGMPEVMMAGVDALIAARFADPEKLILTGFSQGGVSALYVAAHTDRFGAIIAMNSWADFFSHYFGSAGIMTTLYGLFGAFSGYDAGEGSDFGMGLTPFENPEAYYRTSPAFLAPQINAAVLLVHSDMDSFAMSQFDEMYGALLRSGKDARYVRYWGEGHGLSSPANIRDLWRRIDRLLEENNLSPED